MRKTLVINDHQEIKSTQAKHESSLEPSYREAIPQSPLHRDKNVATFALESTGQIVQNDQPLLLFFRIVMKPNFLEDGLAYGFKKVRISFHDHNNNVLLSSLLSEGENMKIKDALLTVVGGKYDPEWFLFTEKGILEGEYRANDPLCGLQGIEVGGYVKAEISVNQHDGSLVYKKNGRALKNKNKQRVLEALCAKELRNESKPNQTGGWLSLGVQIIRIVQGKA